jgi:ABC-type glycerol-3-phosphate transport system substrate-binding protein
MRTLGLILALGLLPAALAALELTVWNRPPEARSAERQLWDEEAASFAADWARQSHDPGFSVNAISRDYIQQQFVSVMAGGKGPDVAHVWVGALPTLARQGLLARLDAETSAWDQRDFVPQVLWDPAKVDGSVYGVPRDSYVTVLLVRRDLWVKAGLDPAVPPADWQALEEDAVRMNDPARGVAGFGFAPTAEAFMDYVWQAGGELLREDAGALRPAFQENAGMAAITFLRRLRFEDGVMQPNPLASRDELAQLFALGHLGMMTGVPSQMPDLISRYGLKADQLLLFPLPAGPAGEKATHASGEYYIVNAASSPEKRAAAWAYIRAMLSPINQLFRWKRMKELGIPVFPGAFSTTAQLNNLPEFRLVQDTLASARSQPYLPNWPLIKDHLETTLLQRLFTQRDADVDALLKQAAQEIQDLYL